MFCTQCGGAITGNARFCGKCGAPVQEGSSLDASPLKPAAAPTAAEKPQVNVTVNEDLPRKPMHVAAYLGLFFGAWIVGAIVTNVISIPLGNAYAEATVPTAIGFWLGKVVLKNKQRDLVGIVAFPIFSFLAGLIGTVSVSALASPNAESMSYSALISLGIAFALSCGLFAVLNNKRAR